MHRILRQPACSHLPFLLSLNFLRVLQHHSLTALLYPATLLIVDLYRCRSIASIHARLMSRLLVLMLPSGLIIGGRGVLLSSEGAVILGKLFKLTLDVVVWRHIERAECDVHVVIGAYQRLVLRLVYALQWADHLQIKIVSLLVLLLAVVCFVLFADHLSNRCVMLLVALVDVRNEWTLAGQEGAAYLQCFSMPVFTLGFDLHWVDVWIVSHVHQEAQFR